MAPTRLPIEVNGHTIDALLRPANNAWTAQQAEVTGRETVRRVEELSLSVPLVRETANIHVDTSVTVPESSTHDDERVFRVWRVREMNRRRVIDCIRFVE